MRVAFFTNNYLPNPYGVSVSVESFRQELEKRGHQVFIFAPLFKDYQDENPHVFRYPSLDVKVKIRYPLPFPCSLRMGKIIKDLKPDIIHSQHPNLLGTAAAKWARKLARQPGGKNIPLIFTWHTLYDHYAHFAKIIPEKWAAGYMIKKAVAYANRADAVIIPTDSILPALRKWGVKNENIIPVPTGIKEGDFKNADRNIIRRKYGVAENEILLLLISRLTREKNIEFIFRSVKKIFSGAEGSQIKFLVAGGGDLIYKLKKFSEEENLTDRIIFSGVVKRGEIKNYYAAGDIFVYGSRSETQGMAITEAMYMGLPIVALKASGTKSLVINKGNGFLVSEKKEEFCRAIIELVKDENLRHRFGLTSRRIAELKFTSSVCAEKLLEVYAQTLASVPKRI